MVSDVLVPLENKTVAYELRWNKKKGIKVGAKGKLFLAIKFARTKFT